MQVIVPILPKPPGFHFISTVISITVFLCFCAGSLFSQRTNSPYGEISGLIQNESGEALIGASILIKDSSQGTLSDEEGRFTLNIPMDSVVVKISYLGYATKEVAIDDASYYEITLSQVGVELSEVVVVAYGKQGRYKVSSALDQVDAEDLDIETRPVSTIESALVGSMPGLVLDQSSGQLGEGTNIQIRSIASLNNNRALILVDGIESSIDNLNPNDIQSVTILKDASSTSIYGTKGANGVVLITTKAGRANEKMTLTYNGNVSFQSAGNTADMLSSLEFMEAFNAARQNENPNARVTYTEEDIARARSGFYPETNWVEELYNENALQSSHNLSLQGGESRYRYFMSLGYLSQDGISQGPDNLERISFRIKVDSDINDWLSVGANVFNANRTLNNLPVSTNSGLRGQPFFPVRLDTGQYAGTYVFKGSTSNEENPIAKVNSGSFDRMETDELNFQAYVKVFPLKGLSVEGRVSYIKRNSALTEWDNPYSYIILDPEDLSIESRPVPFSTQDRSLTEARSSSNRTNVWLLADYERSFEAHNFHLTAGYQAESGSGSEISAGRNGFILDNLQSLSLGTSIPNNLAFGNASDFTLERSVLSYFGRLSYDYQGTYLAELSFRADASSNFINERWAYSPAISLGWNVKNEAFLSGISAINTLKVRASWGRNVDDNILGLVNREVVVFNPSGIGFGNQVQPTILLANSINPDLSWETSEKLNIGLDFTLWEGKLYFSGDYFIDRRKDMIAAVQTSLEGGLTAVDIDGGVTGGILDNVYDSRSFGWEFSIKHANDWGPVGLSVGINLSNYQSKLLNGPSQILNNERLQESGVTPIFGSLYGYKTDGYFHTEEDLQNWVNANGEPIDQSPVVTRGRDGKYLGGYRFVDQNNDGVVNAEDRVIILDDPVDNFRLGANLGLTYKNLELGVRFFGVLGGNEWLNTSNNVNAFASSGVTPFTYQTDTWTEENRDAIFSQSYVNSRPYVAEVSNLIVDRDYIKIKNINLAYTFGSEPLAALKVIKGLNVFVSFENLGVLWTNYPLHPYGFDPEFGSAGFRYPRSLKSSVGVNVKF